MRDDCPGDEHSCALGQNASLFSTQLTTFRNNTLLTFLAKARKKRTVPNIETANWPRISVTTSTVRLKPDDTRWRTGGEVKGKLVNGMGSQYSHTTSERGVSSITQADAHTSAASSRLNWRPRRFKWNRPRFGEWRNLVSARVPSRFKRTIPTKRLHLKTKCSCDERTCVHCWLQYQVSFYRKL